MSDDFWFGVCCGGAAGLLLAQAGLYAMMFGHRVCRDNWDKVLASKEAMISLLDSRKNELLVQVLMYEGASLEYAKHLVYGSSRKLEGFAAKRASRDADAEAIASGAKSREQLWRENSFLPEDAAKAPIEFSRIGSVKDVK